MKISVIIPTLNESKTLASTLEHLLPLGPEEVLIADGGSTDGTLEIASRYPVQVVKSGRGRGLQMNAGAGEARGEVLLFLHADSRVSAAGLAALRRALESGPWLGGAFHLKIDSPRTCLQWISRLANLRSRWLHLVYGDQAMFVRARVFEELGGFASLPICEDLEFYRRLKRRGPVLLLREETLTSPRRWNADGVAYTTFRNAVIASAFLLGFSPRILSRWYPPRR